jgi:hypothetical protein
MQNEAGFEDKVASLFFLFQAKPCMRSILVITVENLIINNVLQKRGGYYKSLLNARTVY